jgi:hypothetical protein
MRDTVRLIHLAVYLHLYVATLVATARLETRLTPPMDARRSLSTNRPNYPARQRPPQEVNQA